MNLRGKIFLILFSSTYLMFIGCGGKKSTLNCSSELDYKRNNIAPLKEGELVDLGSYDFYETVNSYKNVVVIFTGSKYCEPCVRDKEQLDDFFEKYDKSFFDEIYFLVVDRDTNIKKFFEIFDGMKLEAIPTKLFYVDGKVIDSFNGPNISSNGFEGDRLESMIMRHFKKSNDEKYLPRKVYPYSIKEMQEYLENKRNKEETKEVKN